MTGHVMDDGQALANVATLLADPTRAEMLVVLMDGRAFPVSDLAAYAHVSVPTASHHLAKLVKGGLVNVVQQGRHRYHRIASDRVASLVEALGAVRSPVPGVCLPCPPSQRALHHCRSCYNHLAGKVGVQIRLSLESRSLIVPRNAGYHLTSSGSTFLREIGIELGDSVVGKICLDWTERLPHIGGPLGSALFDKLMEKRWVERGEVPRQIRLTPVGQSMFAKAFPIETCRNRKLSI